jgi:four helix bundle protein
MKQDYGVKNGARTRHYRDLLVWQKAMELAKRVYSVTDAFPKSEIFGLQSQMRRAAVSVPSNIAEGHGRLNDGHFRQFLASARGSLFELQTQMEIGGARKLIELKEGRDLMEASEEIARMLNGLLHSLGQS